MFEHLIDVSNKAKLGGGYVTITGSNGNIIADKALIKTLTEDFETYLQELTQTDTLSIDIYKPNQLKKLIKVNETALKIQQTEKQPNLTPKPNNKMENDTPALQKGTDNNFIFQQMINAKDKEISKLEDLYDKIVERYEKAQEKIEALKITNTELNVKVNTADKEKEYALLSAKAENSKSLNGVIKDTFTPETIASIGSVISAIKGNNTDKGNTYLDTLSNDKKESLNAIKMFMDKITDKDAIALAIICTNFKDSTNIRQAYEQLNLPDIFNQQD